MLNLTRVLSADEARALGHAHGALVPDSPANIEQARSDRIACPELRGANEAAQNAYLDGHMEGQRSPSIFLLASI